VDGELDTDEWESRVDVRSESVVTLVVPLRNDAGISSSKSSSSASPISNPILTDDDSVIRDIEGVEEIMTGAGPFLFL
jgi:hypothetical protein